mgnify:CR=1 FL=1
MAEPDFVVRPAIAGKYDMPASTILERLRHMGVTVTVRGDRLRFEPGSVIPEELKQQIIKCKPELRRRVIIEEAYKRADRVNDTLGISDPRVRKINRLSWAVLDLQDAGEPEEVWAPLRDEAHRISRENATAAERQAEADALRELLLELGEREGWPTLELRPGQRLLPGEEAWRKFAAAADIELLEEALNALG